MPRQAATGKRTALHVTLPATPIDGQEIRYLASAIDGVVWTLRYRAASSSPYKWEFIGGPSLYVRDNVDRGPTAGAYGTFGNVQIVLPNVAGDFDIDWGGGFYISGAGNVVRAAIKVGAAAVDDVNGVLFENKSASALTEILVASHRFTAVPAGATIIQQIGGNTGGWGNRRWLRITPVRVG